mmetsp:Transcript_7113/g.15541  ORF Transcript_7113/g.15541 Transcript_7113/m.15541 type:complete len:316 (+) Transcript_7113:477-1424(+)|eukprot:CAMPEP_0178515630 /NCGR_PEP_ID=MMETSP0696-20121128/24660_1 /TAXON_ID=265572 /ORGANISM="Extubocellulus spinifer, Strain CCMP396" /LENGTH=315 /DNA_ID=CAMNT_0020145807 /DNA_START=429 /DNA_END=1376 /DNA_ORIENTATION=-
MPSSLPTFSPSAGPSDDPSSMPTPNPPSGSTPSAVMEWGTISNVGSTVLTVDLSNTYTSAVVVTSINYNNNEIPVVTRISSVTSTSFDIQLQGADDGTGLVAEETVSYLVVEEGQHTVDQHKIEAQKYTSSATDEKNSWGGEEQDYLASYTNPVVVGQVMSTNDPEWSVFWEKGASRQSPPSPSTLFTGITVCEDSNTNRASETIGFIVFEAGHGIMNGVEFEAALGADTIRGVGNSPPYDYSFTSAFATPPVVAVVSMAGVDGANGGWAYVYGSQPTTANTIGLAIDEDSVQDAERRHTTEQVAYIVFSGNGSA